MGTSPIDRCTGWLLRCAPRSFKVLGGGWGDEQGLGYVDTSLPVPSVPPGIELTWEQPRAFGHGLSVTEGYFRSPFHDLPESAQRALVLRVEPAGDADRCCVLLPAWNDHGIGRRRELAAQLAHRGVATVSLEAAFHGRRRTASAAKIHTAADLGRLARSIVVEGRSLVAHLGGSYRELCVSGYSMGGSLAALVGASLDLQVAIAPLAASYSPAPVFLDGVLRHAIDWPALGGRAAAAPRLRSWLSRGTVRDFTPGTSTAAAVLVAATGDGFVPRTATQAIHEHWPGSRLHWVRAGHVTLLYAHAGLLADAVVEAFDQRYARGAGVRQGLGSTPPVPWSSIVVGDP